jgi:hypothetical protein
MPPVGVDVSGGEAARKMKEALERSDRIPALEALKNFLGYCRENHRARNYALFLVGHGLVVGNDAFLPDQHPASAVGLRDLGEALRDFSAGDNGTLQLLALHSCAMSAVEVAYELQGTARYMLGSEGVSYVGSYPYRNLLVKLFNTVKRAEAAGSRINVEGLVENLYAHTLHNATDFILTGYSLDMALCSLAETRYGPLTEVIRGLVSRLKEAVQTERGREMILLAHWDAQSYWDENYTDLYDFCFCLKTRCESLAAMLGKSAELRGEVERLEGLVAACADVQWMLSPKGSKERAARPELAERFEPIILDADNFGSRYQYSHGLSIYFPWSKPLDTEPPPPAPVAPRVKQRAPRGAGQSPGAPTNGDSANAAPPNSALANYATYAFSDPEVFGQDSWLEFLKVYFEATQRRPRKVEVPPEWSEGDGGSQGSARQLDVGASLSNSFQAGTLAKETGSYAKETGSYGDCTCPSIKNYPTELFTINAERQQQIEVRKFTCTRKVLTGDEQQAP